MTDFRTLIDLVEQATPRPADPFGFLFSKPFFAEVREYLEEHLNDWAADHARDTVLKRAISQILYRIKQEALEGDVLVVSRMELRPAHEVETGEFTSVGCFWSYGQGARVCNHDNAYDTFGRDNEDDDHYGLLEVTFVASVKIPDIDWVASIAQNLALPGEEEIRIRGGAHVELHECHFEGGYHNIEKSIMVSDWGGT